MIWKIYSWEDPIFGSTDTQIKLSRESGKKGSFSSWDFREETQCENLPAVTSGCHFCRAVSLLFGLNAVLSSPVCMQDLSIFRICLFVNISWVNLPAFVPSNRHEWTPRRFWFTNPDGTAFSEAAPPSAFYPWLRGFYFCTCICTCICICICIWICICSVRRHYHRHSILDWEVFIARAPLRFG